MAKKRNSIGKRLFAGRLLILLAVTVSGHAYCQQPSDVPDELRFKHVITEILPKVKIEFLFEDSRGLIWGYDHAEKKLFLFDGLDFTYIDPIQDGDLGCQEDSYPTRILEHQDGKLWIQYSCGLYIYDIYANTMKMLNQELKEASQKPVLSIYNMNKGLDGKVHLATQTGVFEYTPATESFEHFDFGDNTADKSYLVYVAFENRHGGFFYGNSRELIWHDNIRDTVFHSLSFKLPISYPPYGCYIPLNNYAIFRGVGLIDGKKVNNGRDFRYFKFDYDSRAFSLLQDDYPDRPPFVRVHEYGESILSIDSVGCLYEYSKKEERFDRLLNLFDFIPNTYSIGELRVFKKIGQDIIWIMTATSTYKLYPSPIQFSTKDYPPTSSDSVSPLHRLPGLVKYQGNVYFKTFPRLLPVRNAQVPAIEIQSLPVDFRNLGRTKFVENPGHGLFGIMNHTEPAAEKGTTGKISHYVWAKDLAHNESYRIHPFPPQSPSDYQGGIIMVDIAAGANGDAWVGGWTGVLNKLSFQEKKVTASIDTRDSIGRFASGLRRILVDQKGLVWVAYHSNGIEAFDSTQVHRFVHDKNDHNSLSSNYITAIYEDNQGRMWVGTQRGLNCINADRTAVTRYFTRDGLFENTISAVLSDKNDRIWVLTPNTISVFSPEQKRFFSHRLSANRMFERFKDYAIDQEGYIFYELFRGAFYFHPDSVQTIEKPPMLYVKSMLVNNASIDGCYFSSSVDLEKGPHQIRLNHDQNSIIINYGACEYHLANEVQFAYRLEGYDREWQNVGNARTATFTKVPPGRYKFILKSANSHGAWSEEFSPIHITILPPWYWAGYSKSLYLLLLAGLLYGFYRFQLKRRLSEVEARRLRELDETKNRIYANITHQFRTPLTLILGMADKIEEAPGRWLKDGVRAIRNNGSNLLRLVRQMLDLSRLEAGKLPLRSEQGDVIPFLRLILELYRSNAEAKGISMSFQTEVETLVMDYDSDKLADIVSNLLSNALKFTPPGGEVRLWTGLVSLDGSAMLKLRVSDTGPGISPEQLPHIFDRFYQGDDAAMRRGEGTGIGLALAAELAKLLGGALEAQSVLGQGAVFYLMLPIHNTAPMLTALPTLGPDIAERPHVLKPIAAPTAGRRPLALIVEDNPDVSAYLVTCLQGHYRVKTAADGQAGVERAIELVPDVIISDVMMPKMDGFELCHTLKEDQRTSHIPIVLLTARADPESRLEGLEMGADAYLAKPFNTAELEVSLRKSLELRDRLQQRYASGSVPAEPKPEFSRDDAFVASLHDYLETHYDDEALSIVAMASALHFSQRQLGRKVSQLFGTTPQLYLRRFRLEKARHLLRTTDRTITEIAHSTGFSGLAYFSRVFLEEFGVPPGEWRVG